MHTHATYNSFVPVVQAQATDNKTILVRLADGRTGQIDLSPLIGKGPWRRLSDHAFFSLARTAFKTIGRADDVDLAPVFVYDHMVFD